MTPPTDPHAALKSRVAALLKTIEGASPAPFSIQRFSLTYEIGVRDADGDLVAGVPDHSLDGVYPITEGDAALLVAARNDAPQALQDLLAALDAEHQAVAAGDKVQQTLMANIEVEMRRANGFIARTEAAERELKWANMREADWHKVADLRSEALALAQGQVARLTELLGDGVSLLGMGRSLADFWPKARAALEAATAKAPEASGTEVQG